MAIIIQRKHEMQSFNCVLISEKSELRSKVRTKKRLLPMEKSPLIFPSFSVFAYNNIPDTFPVSAGSAFLTYANI